MVTPVGREHPEHFAICLGLVQEKHQTELAYYCIKRAVRKRQRRRVCLLEFDLFSIGKFLASQLPTWASLDRSPPGGLKLAKHSAAGA